MVDYDYLYKLVLNKFNSRQLSPLLSVCVDESIELYLKTTVNGVCLVELHSDEQRAEYILSSARSKLLMFHRHFSQHPTSVVYRGHRIADTNWELELSVLNLLND